MQQIALLRQDIIHEFNNARNRILENTMMLTGTSSLGASIILGVILLYIIVFSVIFPLHRKILKKLHLAKQELVKNIDEIIYLLAKDQYASHISKRELWGDPHMAMMKEMFKSWHFEYLDNIEIIKTNVGKVELLLQKQVVSNEQRNKVDIIQKEMKKLIFWKNILGWICTIPTLGVYKLFW